MNDLSQLMWRNLRSGELAELSARNAIVLVPVGAVEQHGPHLPVETDTRLAEEVCIRAARLLGRTHPTVVAPSIWCGFSEHHMAYAGTISVRFQTFSALLHDVCETVQRHGGNVDALRIIVGTLSRELTHPVHGLTYCHLADCAAAYSDILDDQENVLHAGEAETSMMLVLARAWVDEEAMLNASNVKFTFAKDRDIYGWLRFDQLSETGVNGITKNSSAEKGEALLTEGAKAVAAVTARTFDLV